MARSLRWWLISLAAAVALPLLVLLVSLFASQLKREQFEARETALRVARAAASRLRLLNEDSVALLNGLAVRPDIRNFNGRTCDSLFAIVDFFPQYANLLLFETNGRLDCSGSPKTASEIAASASATQSIEIALRTGTLRMGRPLVGPAGDELFSAVSIPVNGDDGSRRVLSLVALPDIATKDALPANGVLTIIDRSGTIVARSEHPARWIGRSARGTEVAEVALREVEGRAEAIGVDGVARQYGFTLIPELGWSVYVGIPAITVMQPVRDLFVVGLEGGVLLVLIVVVAAMLISRRIEQPINALVRATDLVANGRHTSVAVGARAAPLEIQTLATAFNSMVEKRLDAELKAQESERSLKALSERLLEVQEEERTRIARAIHDDLGQSLTALKMDVLGLIAQAGQSVNSSPLAARISKTLDETVNAVQRISTELRPSVLDDLGLVSAIESESRLFEERTGIECEVSMPPEALEIEPEIAIALYRIAQEALTNVVRHSNATRVEIRLRRRPDEVLLEVRDDGRGVKPEEVSSASSLGLIGIRERAAIVGGTVHFEGIAGRGTIVSVRIPAVMETA